MLSRAYAHQTAQQQAKEAGRRTTSVSTSSGTLSPPPLRSVSSRNASGESLCSGASALMPLDAFMLLPPARGGGGVGGHERDARWAGEVP